MRAICTSQSSDVVHAQELYHITFAPLSVKYALGFNETCMNFFSYATEMPATANQQQTLLFHPENKKLESV